jgi:small subunit ribosomal protein S1
VLEEERKEQRQKILDNLNPGDVVEGQISNIVDFGAFVDLDGMDGLIHISELSWSHVNHPSEVLEIGQTVEVKVLDIDRDRQRISLGLKQTQSDPWQQVVDTYSEGDVVDGKVTKVVTFGAFVEILAGVEGLVHISELAAHHVENPREIVAQGDDVKVLVLEIDGERRRLSLSLKRVEGGRAITEEEAAHLTGHIELPDDYTNAAPAPELDEVDEADEPDELVAETSDDAAEGDAATIDADPAEEPVAEVEVAEEPVAEVELAEEPVVEAEAEVVEEPAAEAEPAAAAEAEPVSEPDSK